MRKVLYSPGYGAGWSTWNGDQFREDFLFDPLLIEAVEQARSTNQPIPDHVIEAFCDRVRAKHGLTEKDDYLCVLGAKQLSVATIHGQFIVEEYDGSESFRYRDTEDWL